MLSWAALWLPDSFCWKGFEMGRRFGAFLAALSIAGRIVAAEAEAPEEISPWDTTVTLRAGGGYKKNILLSDFNRESSAFSLTSADFFLYHLPVNQWELSEFATIEDRRYLQSESVDKEIMVLSTTDLKRLFGESFKAGLNFEYFYSDQVFDASISEGIPLRIKAKLHKLSSGPTTVITLPGKRRIEFAGIVTRQLFGAPLDDSWEFGPKLILGQKFGYGSDLTVKLAWRDRLYDTRIAPGRTKSLRFEQWETEAGLKYNFDKEKHWNSRLRAGYEWNYDNGSGFFDYEKLRISSEAGFTKGGFLANLQGKFLRYDYTTQRGLSGLGRRMSEVTVVARVEQEVVRRIKIFAEYEHEWVSATDVSDRYRTTTFTAGLEWEVK